MTEVCAANGSRTAVAQSGTSSMSDSLIAFQPAMDEPSNGTPSLRNSSLIVRTWWARCCHLPRGSVKRKSTYLASCSLIISRTCFVSAIARFRVFKVEGTKEALAAGPILARPALPGWAWRRRSRSQESLAPGLSSPRESASSPGFSGQIASGSNRIGAALSGADADRLIDRRDEDLAVADPASMRGLLDRLDGALDHRFLHDHLDFDLGQEIDDVFGAAIEFGVALLPTKALGLGHGDALDADLVKRLLHLVELERLDDRFDLLHRSTLCAGWPALMPRQSITHARAAGDDSDGRSGFSAAGLGESGRLCLIFTRKVAEKLADAFDRLANRLDAAGVGKAQVILAECPKAGAGDRRDPGLVEQLALQVAGAVAGPRDVRERVKRTARLDAADPRQRIQRRDDDFAPLGEGLDHPLDRLARAFEGGDAGPLRRRIDAGMAIDRQPLGMREQRLRPHAVAHTPAGHRIGLAPAVEQDDLLADRGIGEQADMLGAVIEDLAIDLVAHDRDMRVLFETGDEAVEFGARHDAARRIGRAVDDQEPRLRRDLFQHLLGAERKALALVKRHRHRRRAGKLDDAFVDRETGVRVEDLHPRLAEHHDREEHRDLAARHDEHLVGRHLDSVAAPKICGNGGAQRRDAVGWGIAVMTVGEGLAAGLDDMRRGRKIGLADAEIDDRAVLRRQRLGARQHLEGGFGAENPHPAGHLQHAHAPSHDAQPRAIRGGNLVA